VCERIEEKISMSDWIQKIPTRRVIYYSTLFLFTLINLNCGKSALGGKSGTSSASNDSLIIGANSDLAASVSVPKSSLPTDATVTVSAGQELATQDTQSLVDLSNASFSKAAAPVIVSSSVPVNPGLPLQLQIPVPTISLGLSLVDDSQFVILYKIIDYTKNEIRLGIFPRSKFIILGTSAFFTSPYFGEFQVVVASKIITSQVEVVVNTPILAKNGNTAIPLPTNTSTSTSTSTSTATAATLSTLPPLAAKVFSVTTGTANQGDINISITFDSDLNNDAKAEIHAIPGPTAPDPKCTNTGDTIAGVVTDFSNANANISFASGSVIGGIFSFRLCIFGLNGLLTSVNTALSVVARDVIPPPPLSSFTAGPGQFAGDIILNWILPPDISDYAIMNLNAVAGPNAPPDCSPITRIASFPPPFIGLPNTSTGPPTGTSALMGTFVFTVPLPSLSASTVFSFRACIFDRVGNLMNVNTLTAISPQPLIDASTGLLFAGDILLNAVWPENPANFYQATVWRVQGAIAPTSACDASSGTLVTSYNTFVGAANFVDSTSDISGNSYSYRICIRDPANNLIVSSVALNVQALPAASFQNTSTTSGFPTLTFLFPPNPNSTLSTISLFRQSGPLGVDCSTNPQSPLISFNPPYSTSSLIFSDATAVPGIYSYSYCVNTLSSGTTQVDLLNETVTTTAAP